MPAGSILLRPAVPKMGPCGRSLAQTVFADPDGAPAEQGRTSAAATSQRSPWTSPGSRGWTAPIAPRLRACWVSPTVSPAGCGESAPPGAPATCAGYRLLIAPLGDGNRVESTPGRVAVRACLWHRYARVIEWRSRRDTYEGSVDARRHGAPRRRSFRDRRRVVSPPPRTGADKNELALVAALVRRRWSLVLRPSTSWSASRQQQRLRARFSATWKSYALPSPNVPM